MLNEWAKKLLAQLSIENVFLKEPDTEAASVLIELGAIKTLISTNLYSEEEIWEI